MSDNSLDFSAVLATTVHDMKNSLCMLTQSIESLALKAKQSQSEEQHELSRLHYEASRISGSLMQLLAIYRSDHDVFPLTIEEVFVTDLLSDIIGTNLWCAEQKGIRLNLDAEPDLAWFCDSELISFLISDVLLNAIRYCDKEINISAIVADNQLEITVLNDGDSFPDEFLKLAAQDLPNSIEVTKNRSGLGLYFAKLIAKAHCHEDKCGSIILSNQENDQGSVFVLRLP